MKKLTIVLTLFPFFAFSQEARNQLSLLGGFEFQDSKTLAWNIQTNFNRQSVKFSRWSAEYGAGFYVLEHRRYENMFVNDTFPVLTLTYGNGKIIWPGYLENNYIHYSRTTGIRIQAGVNYTILKKSKVTLSAGINVVNDILLTYKEHGQRVLTPVMGYGGDTLPFIEYHYSIYQKTSTTSNAISLQIQPHIDLSFPLTEKILFTSRLGYYGQVIPEFKFVRPQLSAGVSYQW